MSKGLGKGLSALISDKNIVNREVNLSAKTDKLTTVSNEKTNFSDEDFSNKQLSLKINKIKAGKFQPRTNFDKE